MPVLVEALSVIVAREAIQRAYPGGWAAFVDAVPNRTLCFDDDLARIGFMSREDVKHFIDELTSRGLCYLVDDEARDIAVIDQLQGFMVNAPWLEMAQLHSDEAGGVIVVCRRWGSADERIALPARWRFAGSLSERGGFVAHGEESQRLKYLRTEGNMDVFEDLSTGHEVFMGRTSRSH